MVVAHEGLKEPWFVAVVVARQNDMLTLKWRATMDITGRIARRRCTALSRRTAAA
jgi:hypothetical protein